MRSGARRRITGSIRALVPCLREKGRFLAAVPRGRILRGVYLEDSSDSTRVYISAFVQPLYVPSEMIVLSLADRLGGGSRTWSVEDANAAAVVVRDQGVPFFEPMVSPEAVASWGFLVGRTDEYAREVRAYSLVASGRFIEGAHALRELARSLAAATTWMVEMQKRARQLAALAESNPGGAGDLLAKWQAETAAALHVEDLE